MEECKELLALSRPATHPFVERTDIPNMDRPGSVWHFLQRGVGFESGGGGGKVINGGWQFSYPAVEV